MASYKLCTCSTCKRNNWRKYVVRWRDKAGKQKSKHADSSAQAKQILVQVERDLAVGRNNQDYTLNEFAKEVPYAKGEQANKEIMEKVWEKHIAPNLGNIKLVMISRADINKFVQDDLKGYAPATQRKYLGLVDRALDYAVADKIIEVNPCKLVYIDGAKREREPNPLTPDQLFDFIQVWDNDPILKEHANFVTALAFTGMRPSECSALRWENVDLKGRELRVRESFRTRANGSIYLSTELKTPKAKRTLAIPEYLLGRLQFRKDTHPHEEFVFSSLLGYPIMLNNFRRRYWRRSLTLINTPVDVPYDLRHTFSALMYSTGITVYELSDMMGHRNPTTTIDWYGDWFDKANHNAVQVLDNWADGGITKFKTS